MLANGWHIPDNTADLGVTMRSPEFEIGTNTTVTVHSGVQKYNNSFGTANQTGGWLIYKGQTQGTWSSNALSFYLNGGPSPNNRTGVPVTTRRASGRTKSFSITCISHSME